MHISHSEAGNRSGTPLGRRHALAALVLLGIAGCSPLTLRRDGVGSDAAPHWDYDADGPGHWADLDRDYVTCKAGHAQSPIDLPGHPSSPPAGRIGIEYGAVASVELVNTGHTVQGNLPARNGNRILVDGMPFTLAQFHFHLPSEHTVDGARTAMELHLVHRGASGALAVLGIPMEQAPGRSAFEPVLTVAPASSRGKVRTGPIDLRAFLPADLAQFRYAGSLTTPPCSEGVLWTVLRTPVAVAPAEVDRYRTLFPHSNRPTQPLNGRTVIATGP